MASPVTAFNTDHDTSDAAFRTSTASAIRSGVERGDPFAILSDRAMARSVDATESVSAPHLAALPARADHPVADDPDGTDLKLGVVEAEADGQDADAMEHERQSRRRRWQTQQTR